VVHLEHEKQTIPNQKCSIYLKASRETTSASCPSNRPAISTLDVIDVPGCQIMEGPKNTIAGINLTSFKF
jgi:hypothetical protein